jgi:hypothetical protein
MKRKGKYKVEDFKVKQGSVEWFALKNGILSASTIHRLICSKNRLKKGELLSKGAKTYIREKVSEKCYPEQERDDFESNAMQRGTMLEPVAILRFELMYGYKVEKTGFFTFSDWLGCSTDGIVYETKTRKAILEVKCPEKRANHLHYCTMRNWEDIKKVSPLLFWQMNLGMFITGIKRAWFVSYDPRLLDTKNKHLALFSLCLEADQKYIDELCCSLGRGWVYKNKFEKSLYLK